MFEIIKGYPDNLAVEAVDDHTLRVTLMSDVPYWNELLAFPTYFPVYKPAVSGNGNWFSSPSTYVSNGAYRIEKWDHDSLLVLSKNPDYHGAKDVAMKKINFHMSDDSYVMYANYQTGDWQFIDDFPFDVSSKYYTSGIMGTYYFCWNITEPLLPD